MILGNPLLGFLLSSFLKNLLRYDIKYAHMAKKLGLLVKKYIYIYIYILGLSHVESSYIQFMVEFS